MTIDSPPPTIPLQVSQSTVGPITDAAALGMSSIGQKDVAVTPLQNALDQLDPDDQELATALARALDLAPPQLHA